MVKSKTGSKHFVLEFPPPQKLFCEFFPIMKKNFRPGPCPVPYVGVLDLRKELQQKGETNAKKVYKLQIWFFGKQILTQIVLRKPLYQNKIYA